VPGLAKTLLISTLARRRADASFNRIQFTPDLMPSDITGTEVHPGGPATGARVQVPPGPDLRERRPRRRDQPHAAEDAGRAARGDAGVQVTVGGQRHDLPEPFFVLATQNPIEQEGTYPLPEAQLDRFMFMIQVDYPTTGGAMAEPEKMIGIEELQEIQRVVRSIPAADHVLDYALALTRGTRVKNDSGLPFLKEWVTWGAGPRAGQYLVLAAKAHAALAGRDHASVEDVRAIAKPVLRHRILTNYAAEQEGMTSDVVIERLLKEIDASGGVGAGLPGVKAR
jgi:MoxR-like ATPase